MAKLAKKDARHKSGLFLLEGPQALEEALRWRPELVVETFLTEEAAARYPQFADGAHLVTGQVLAAMADTVTPQGVLAVCRQFPVSLDEVLAESPKLVAVLEEVRDPGNAGTVIRAADAAGADAVILSGRSVDLYNPKVVRATTGSIFHLPVLMGGPLADVVVALRAAGLQVLAADIKGEDLLAARRAGVLSAPTAWVFGNEARGLEDDQLALADRAITVPIYGRAESLNLATAASVCLFESAFAQR